MNTGMSDDAITPEEIAFARRMVDEHDRRPGPKTATRVVLRLYRERYPRQDFEFMRDFMSREDGHDYQSEAEFA